MKKILALLNNFKYVESYCDIGFHSDGYSEFFVDDNFFIKGNHVWYQQDKDNPTLLFFNPPKEIKNNMANIFDYDGNNWILGDVDKVIDKIKKRYYSELTIASKAFTEYSYGAITDEEYKEIKDYMLEIIPEKQIALLISKNNKMALLNYEEIKRPDIFKKYEINKFKMEV